MYVCASVVTHATAFEMHREAVSCKEAVGLAFIRVCSGFWGGKHPGTWHAYGWHFVTAATS